MYIYYKRKNLNISLEACSLYPLLIFIVLSNNIYSIIDEPLLLLYIYRIGDIVCRALSRLVEHMLLYNI